jgi:hypothetical protein
MTYQLLGRLYKPDAGRTREASEKQKEYSLEDFTVEDFMFSDLMKPHLGEICEYCALKGYAPTFNSMDRYVDHVAENHKNLSMHAIYALPDDLGKERET